MGHPKAGSVRDRRLGRLQRSRQCAHVARADASAVLFAEVRRSIDVSIEKIRDHKRIGLAVEAAQAQSSF